MMAKHCLPKDRGSIWMFFFMLLIIYNEQDCFDCKQMHHYIQTYCNAKKH